MGSVTPLYVLMTVMQRKWEAKDEDGAVALAKVIAPYMHPKVPAARPIGDLSGVSDDELDVIERDLRANGAVEGPG